MKICQHCHQPLPILCPQCGRVAHFLKSKKSSTGMKYQVRECDYGHRFVVTPDGKKSIRYSRELEAA